MKIKIVFFLLAGLVFYPLYSQNPGDVVIAEIMKNPSFTGNLDSLGEWFELWNPTVNPIDIAGWIIHDNDFDRDTIQNGGPLLIPAGGYITLGSLRSESVV